MGTRSLFSMAACCAFLIGAAAAQSQPSRPSQFGRSALDAALYRSVCERVQAPVVFSTRDTLFALSLPTDEPATIALRVTVGKNGKVKEKLTRVDANHIAGYVAPAFIAATEDLRIDKSLLGHLAGKDTSVLLTFPLEYQCVYDTVNKAHPEEGLTKILSSSFHSVDHHPITRPMPFERRNRYLESDIASYPGDMKELYSKMPPTRVWYYLAFIKGEQE